ncbi:MAG: antitoxin [Actinomycetota bacterium]
MLSHRLQVLLDEGRYHRLAASAAKRGVSIGHLIREAIDRSLPPDEDRRAAAAQRILEAEPMAVGDVADLKRELDEVRAGRG